MKNNLLSKISSAGSIKAQVMADSIFFNDKPTVKTLLPILNIAFSGDINGGLVSGLTIFAGESKTFKTLLGLFSMKAYLDHYPEGIAILYDSEFGITPDYLKNIGIDINRVIHIPVEHIEQLKFDISKRLSAITRGDKVFIMVDSLGALPSKKEIEDAIDEKSVADMTRAKAVRSVLRIISPILTIKDIPCIIINHVYASMQMYSAAVVGGGTAVTYMSNQIFIISRSQEKEGTEITGWKFTITINKSRFVVEKSKVSFQVSQKNGINKYSGLLELALESGHVIKPSNGWYSRVIDGAPEETKHRLKQTNTGTFWDLILKDPTFNDWIKKKFQLNSNLQLTQEDNYNDDETTDIEEIGNE